MSVTRRGLKMPAAPDSLSVEAGILANATYPAQKIIDHARGVEVDDARAGMHVATIAAALEYGTGQNHPRPFMQTTVLREKEKWVEGILKLLTRGSGADPMNLFPVNPKQALATIGQVMKEDIQATINAWPADNSDKWAAFKGFNKGLTFTSHLLNSVESAVKDKS